MASEEQGQKALAQPSERDFFTVCYRLHFQHLNNPLGMVRRAGHFVFADQWVYDSSTQGRVIPPVVFVCPVTNQPCNVKEIDRGTVRDLGGLLVNGGHLITVNPCSDAGADRVCDGVLRFASGIAHDGVIVVERMQSRGDALIDRPHVHWAISEGEADVDSIVDQLRSSGLDVHITPIWAADGLFYYLAKDPHARCYLTKMEHTRASALPVAHEGREASGPIVPIKTENLRSETEAKRLPASDIPPTPLPEYIETESAVAPSEAVKRPLTRGVHGMCRAP